MDDWVFDEREQETLNSNDPVIRGPFSFLVEMFKDVPAHTIYYVFSSFNHNLDAATSYLSANTQSLCTTQPQTTEPSEPTVTYPDSPTSPPSDPYSPLQDIPQPHLPQEYSDSSLPPPSTQRVASLLPRPPTQRVASSLPPPPTQHVLSPPSGSQNTNESLDNSNSSLDESSYKKLVSKTVRVDKKICKLDDLKKNCILDDLKKKEERLRRRLNGAV
uniref:CUE domain-containing protein n=1 Tax=Panagrolaimus sp. ES5 TaxID=591445 RepID=A0AC34G8Y7_9BILA